MQTNKPKNIADKSIQDHHFLLAKMDKESISIASNLGSSFGMIGDFLDMVESLEIGGVSAINKYKSTLKKIKTKRSEQFAVTEKETIKNLNNLTGEIYEQTEKNIKDYAGTTAKPAELMTIYNTSKIDGIPIKNWFKDIQAKEYANIKKLANVSISEGLSIQEQTEWFKGIFKTTESSTRSMARTAYIEVAGDQQNDIYKKNSDVIKYVRRVETLDGRTCLICAGIDGMKWEIGSKDAIIGAVHPNCRGLLVPETSLNIEFDRPSAVADFDAIAKRDYNEKRKKEDKPWDQLEYEERTRLAYRAQKSFDNPYVSTSERTTYETWFNRQDVQFKKDILGPKRYELYKDEKIQVVDFASIEKGIIPIKKL